MNDNDKKLKFLIYRFLKLKNDDIKKCGIKIRSDDINIWKPAVNKFLIKLELHNVDYLNWSDEKEISILFNNLKDIADADFTES